MINKKIGQHLRRPCKRCGEYFTPTTKNCRVCEECIRKSYETRTKYGYKNVSQ